MAVAAEARDNTHPTVPHMPDAQAWLVLPSLSLEHAQGRHAFAG
jgi:hypothetical protein